MSLLCTIKENMIGYYHVGSTLYNYK